MKDLKNLGKSLSKKEQQNILGGTEPHKTGCSDDPTANELHPPCGAAEQALADAGDEYWECICDQAAQTGGGGTNVYMNHGRDGRYKL